MKKSTLIITLLTLLLTGCINKNHKNHGSLSTSSTLVEISRPGITPSFKEKSVNNNPYFDLNIIRDFDSSITLSGDLLNQYKAEEKIIFYVMIPSYEILTPSVYLNGERLLYTSISYNNDNNGRNYKYQFDMPFEKSKLVITDNSFYFDKEYTLVNLGFDFNRFNHILTGFTFNIKKGQLINGQKNIEKDYQCTDFNTLTRITELLNNIKLIKDKNYTMNKVDSKFLSITYDGIFNDGPASTGTGQLVQGHGEIEFFDNHISVKNSRGEDYIFKSMKDVHNLFDSFID